MSFKYIGLDISPNRIGLAIGEDNLIHIDTYVIIKSKKRKEVWKEELMNFYRKHKGSIKETFVGLPYESNGSLGDAAKYVKVFAHGIRDIISPFSFVDERYTTRYAKTITKDLKEQDKIAAQIILINGVIKRASNRN